MPKYRQGRLNEAIANELSIALGKVRDPRVSTALISITRAEVTPDLKQAKIYFSTMDDPEEVSLGLSRASGVLRHHLAETLNLRLTPQLTFCHDSSISHGARIATLLKQIEDERVARNVPEADAQNEQEDGE